jgi:replicative DNA helicase
VAAQPDVGVSPSPASYDRVPPHNLDAEVSVLGSMLLSRDAIAEVSEFIGPEDFYRGAHRTMFEAIRALYDRGEPVDPVTLADDLECRGRLGDVGGALAIADLVAKVPTAANALYYARIVADHALRRRLIDVGTEITRLGYQAIDGADLAVDTAESLVYQVAQRGMAREFTSMKELLTSSFELIERLHDQDSAITGLSTGFVDLDECTAGLQPSNLVILAARPAMGKCVTGATPVLDPRTGALRPIRAIVEDYPSHEVTVASLDDGLRLCLSTPSALLDNGIQPVLRLRTRLGRELSATGSHPLLTPDGWLPLSSLRPGARIACPRVLPFFGDQAPPDAEVALLATHVACLGRAETPAELPERVFRLTRSTLAQFLQRLFQVGGIHTRCGITYPAGTPARARQVAHLLLRFGVTATVQAHDGCWETVVDDPAALAALPDPAGSGRDDLAWDEAVSIEPVGEDRVYDLTVPGGHNFVAADLIVHNSTLATNVAAHVAVNLRKPVVLFSLEMSQMELVLRILAGEARVDSDRLRTGRLQESDWPKLSQAMGRLAEAPLFIDDTPGINLMEVRSKCRRIKQKHGLDLVVIDYLQLMQPTRRIENRVQEVAELSRGLKILAKELEIPVIALSQLSRKPEDRADRRPQLADLRDSGCLTADTRITRADTGVEVTMADLLHAGARNVPVWSLDDQLSLVPSVMTHVFSSGSKPVYRVQLASGRTVKATANHPFRVIDGWLPLAELTVGSQVAVPRFLPEPTAVTHWPEGRVIMVAHLVGDDAIPDQIFTLPCAQVRLFLRHLWATDDPLSGSDRPMSRRQAEGVQTLLLRLGIQSRLVAVTGRAGSECYTLDVAASEHQRRFLERAGINGARSAQVEARMDPRNVAGRPSAPTRTRLRDDQELRCSTESDVSMDTIVEITLLGEEPVYDATVIGTHNFLANGIVVHNSIEQDADIVCFIYRDEVYDKDSSAKGEAELIVAKHRNGPLRTVHLSFLGHHSRFANMARGPMPPNVRPDGPRPGGGI